MINMYSGPDRNETHNDGSMRLPGGSLLDYGNVD